MDGSAPDHGFWSIEMDGMASIQQAYVRNTPVLRTVMTAVDGASCEIIDFAPAIRNIRAPIVRWPSRGSCGPCPERRASACA